MMQLSLLELQASRTSDEFLESDARFSEAGVVDNHFTVDVEVSWGALEVSLKLVSVVGFVVLNVVKDFVVAFETR